MPEAQHCEIIENLTAVRDIFSICTAFITKPVSNVLIVLAISAKPVV